MSDDGIHDRTPANTHYIQECWLLATVAAHLYHDETEAIGGGVTAREVADSMGRAQNIISEHLRDLCEEGTLHRTQTKILGKSGNPYAYHWGPAGSDGVEARQYLPTGAGVSDD